MTMKRFLIGMTIFCLLFFAVYAASKTTVYKPKREVFVGVFREGAPRNMAHIKKFEEQVGIKPATIMWYQDWNQNFPRTDAQDVIDYGSVPHIVWEPWYWHDHSKVQLKDIIAGKWDNYIRSWAQEISAFGHPIFLRVAHEFNIEGYPWGTVNNEKDPQIYIDAYRHVVDIFKKEKADNVQWVWCFMNYSYPQDAWNDWVKAYPGDKYVDWVGIDGYNWGTTQNWSEWQAFKYLFQDQVRLSKKLWPDKPIMIAEFASAEKGGDKAEWIKEIPGYLKSSMRDIDLILWFDLRKETDWRIKSSKQSLAAFQTIMQDPIFSSSGEALANLKVKPRTIQKKLATAVKAPGKIKIDANLSDWNKSCPITMKDESYLKEGLIWGGLADLSGDAYIMWDEENFYLAAEIADKIPLINDNGKQNIWNGDCIEIVLGLSPERVAGRTSLSSGDYQIGFSTGNEKDNDPIVWSWQRRRPPSGSDIVVKKVSQPLGYVLEAKIPWKFFRGKFAPYAGAKIDFDIAFDDADESGERERQFLWNGDYFFYKDPSVWGVLEFK